MKNCKIIVPGGLNTDIIASGVPRLLQPGQLTLGGELSIGPGGKARNMAQMAAAYLGPDLVAMIGITSKDPLGLWQVPMKALEQAGVNTEHIKVLSFDEASKTFPGVALIPVDTEGRNQIYVLPGVNEMFGEKDLNDAEELFQIGSGSAAMILALEIPFDSVLSAIEKAKKYNIKVILDPGGISAPIDDLISDSLFFIKPNEHEAKIITGIEIVDFDSAQKAANYFMTKGVGNVLITHGENGGYFFSEKISLYIPVPNNLQKTGHRDETGCGDQVTAVLAAALSEGIAIEDAAAMAVFAGTMQFNRLGIQPVTKSELKVAYR